MAKLTHLDDTGRARMVDLTAKGETARRAVASCLIRMGPEAARTLKEGTSAKGDVLAAARIAGIQAGKQTSQLIPLCHPVRTTHLSVDAGFTGESTLELRAEAAGVDRTGMEMEAMVAAAVAALTVYDMLKAVDRGMTIGDLRLLEKSGGKSGDWRRAGP
ncbi:MAG: cyclic pyranopterin monophosphate synthase MoaC [Planctomycetaceae bacterium]